MPNATILQPFGFEIYWQMLFYFVAKGKTAHNVDKCNKKLCNKPHKNIEQTRFKHLQETKLSKKGKMQVAPPTRRTRESNNFAETACKYYTDTL